MYCFHESLLSVASRASNSVSMLSLEVMYTTFEGFKNILLSLEVMDTTFQGFSKYFGSQGL